MKLHLPKILFTAVIACMGMNVRAEAATNVAANETLVVESGIENEEYNVGENATLDINGQEIKNGTVNLSEGAVLKNSGNSIADNAAQLKVLSLSGNAKVTAEKDHDIGMIGGNWDRTTITLNSNTLTKDGDGTFFINNTDINDSGKVQVNGGTLQICVSGSTGKSTIASAVEFSTTSDTSTVDVIAGASLTAAGMSGEKGKLQGAANSTLTIGSASDYTYGGAVTGGFRLTKVGSGTQTFSGVTTLGTVQVNEGMLKFSGQQSTISNLVATANTIVYDGGTHTITNITAAVTQVFSIENNAQLTINGVTLAKDHTLSLKGGSEAQGYYTLDGTSESVDGNGFYVEQSTYTLFTGYQWDGAVDGYNVITEDGNTYLTGTGAAGTEFFVRSGTVAYNAATMSNATAFNVANKATYTRDMGSETVNINSYLSNITAEAGSNISVSTSGAVTQSAALTIADGGTLTIDGAASYANGAHAINGGGTLVLNNVTNANFTKGNNDKLISSNLTLSGNTTLSLTGGDAVDYGKALIWEIGTGSTLDFGSSRQAFASGSRIILEGGTIAGTGDDYGALDLQGGAKVEATATSSITATVRVRREIEFNVADNQTLTVSGAVKDDVHVSDNQTRLGGINKKGAGTLVLQAANDYSNGTTVTAGTLETANSSALGTGSVTVSGGKLKTTSDLKVSSLTISADGTLEMAGGKLTVSGSLTLSTLSVDFSKYFDAESLSTTLITAESISNWAGDVAGTYTHAGAEYNTLISQSENTITLSFKQEPAVNDSLTNVTVLGSEFADGMLTLTIDKDITSASLTVEITGFGDNVLDSILAQTSGDEDGIVGITLVDGKQQEITITGNGENIGFFGAYYGEQVGSNAYQVAYIPEPATATLSLLALCGLAARRRRR